MAHEPRWRLGGCTSLATWLVGYFLNTLLGKRYPLSGFLHRAAEFNIVPTDSFPDLSREPTPQVGRLATGQSSRRAVIGDRETTTPPGPGSGGTHQVAKLLLEHANSIVDREEAVKSAMALGMPLHEIEDYLDWLDQFNRLNSRI